MGLKAIVIVAVIATLLFFPQSTFAQETGLSVTISNKEEREIRLEQFLTAHRSPLAPYSHSLISTADKYQLDWRLIPAVSGVESSFALAMPADSYNAYGWQNGQTRFASWEDSFEIVAKTLKNNYVDKGLDTVAKISRVYAPPSQTWAKNVQFFIDEINNFPVENNPNNQTTLPLYL